MTELVGEVVGWKEGAWYMNIIHTFLLSGRAGLTLALLPLVLLLVLHSLCQLLQGSDKHNCLCTNYGPFLITVRPKRLTATLYQTIMSDPGQH